MSADIPLLKINYPEVRNLLLNHPQRDPPEESNLWENCLFKSYEKTLKKI
jgi:hypothetical protein